MAKKQQAEQTFDPALVKKFYRNNERLLKLAAKFLNNPKREQAAPLIRSYFDLLHDTVKSLVVSSNFFLDVLTGPPPHNYSVRTVKAVEVLRKKK